MQNQNKWFNIIIIILLAIVLYYMFFKENESPVVIDRTEYFKHERDSAKSIAEAYKNKSDSLLSLANESGSQAKEIVQFEKENNKDHEAYIFNHIIDTSSDSVLLMSKSISDSILSRGFIGVDTY